MKIRSSELSFVLHVKQDRDLFASYFHARFEGYRLGMPKLSPHEIRTIAVAAVVDPRSVMKALSGKPLHELTLNRIKNALVRDGRAELLPNPPAPPPSMRGDARTRGTHRRNARGEV